MVVLKMIGVLDGPMVSFALSAHANPTYSFWKPGSISPWFGNEDL